MAVGSLSAPAGASPTRVRLIAAAAAAAVIAMFAWLSTPAQAKSSIKQAFNEAYGTTGSRLDSCRTCHTTKADKAHLNEYGKDLNATANHKDFAAIEQKDSDGDGVSNLKEIQAGTFPGYAGDYPGHPGEPPLPATTTTAPPNDLMSQINGLLKSLGLGR